MLFKRIYSPFTQNTNCKQKTNLNSSTLLTECLFMIPIQSPAIMTVQRMQLFILIPRAAKKREMDYLKVFELNF